MYRKLGILSNGQKLAILMREETVERLAAKTFRGRGVRCAGNFSRWNSIEELIDDPRMRDLVCTKCMEIVNDEIRQYRDNPGHSRISERFEIEFPFTVGWSGTVSLDAVSDDEIEAFQPNKKSSALRIRADSPRGAAMTQKVTFACEFRKGDKKWSAVIHDVYPGPDVGGLKGNVSARAGVVFFDPEHHGV